MGEVSFPGLGGGGATLPIAESDVTGLVSDLAAKAPLASPALTGHPTGVTESPGDNSTRLASTAYVDTASGLLVPKSVLTTKGDIIVASAASTPSRLGIGSVGQRPMVGASSTLEYAPSGVPWNLPSGWLAATYDRNSGNGASVALAGVTGISVLQGIWLPAGLVVSSIKFMSGGTTTMSGATHQWFFLTDSSLVQVATTHDDTNTAWSLNTVKSLAVEQIASGASSTYTVPTTGWYYLGYNIQATTMPTGIHQNGLVANQAGLAPITVGTSADAASTSGPPSFTKTYGALTSVSKILYGGVG